MTRRTRNSKRPSRTRVRSWKRQSLLLCPVKLRRIVGVVYPTKFKQNLCVFWKLMNPQECVWETRYHQTTKTILQEKVREFITALQLGSQTYSYASSYEKFRQRKQEKISAWNLTKVKSKKEVIDEARCKHLYALRWHTQGRKDELTSCRGYRLVGVAIPPVSRERGRTGLPKKGKWSPRGTGNRQAPPIPAQQPAVYRWQ